MSRSLVDRPTSARWSRTTRASAPGRSASIDDARVVIVDGVVDEVGPAARVGADADERIDAEGACVLPGFVDSHTHLVFAGDRAEEFTARMAGRPYDGGGIRVTTDATRATSTDELDRLVRAPNRRSTTGRDDDASRSSRATGCRWPTRHGRSRSPRATPTSRRSSAPTSCPPSSRDGPTTTSTSSATRCSRQPRPHARWIDAFCETGAFDAEQSRRVLEAGRAAGLGLRLHGNQLGPRPGCAARRRAAAAPRSTTAPISPTPTSTRWRRATRSRRSCRPPTSPPASRIRMPAGRSTPACRWRMASNCNPGSSYTTSISFCIALAVRDMGMTIEEAIQSVTVGGAAALRRDRRRPPRTRGCWARRDPRRSRAPPPRVPARRPPGPYHARLSVPAARAPCEISS